MPNIAYHYDVTITPDIPKKFLRPAFDEFNRQFFPGISMAYDGKKSFYTVELLKIDGDFSREVQIENTGRRPITFKLVIRTTDDIEVNLESLYNYMEDRIFDKPMRALQCLELVFANPCHDRGVRAGRSFYNPSTSPQDLGDGFKFWLDLYQAMVLGEKPLLNVDIAQKSFPKEMSKEINLNLLRLFDHSTNSVIKTFGIRIDPKFIDVPIRVLNSPMVEYFGRETFRVSNGSWQMENTTKFLITNEKQHKWAVLYSRKSRSMGFLKLQSTLVRLLKDAAREINLNLDPKPLIDSFQDIESKFNELKKEKYDVVIVVIPFRGTTYAEIKTVVELQCGILMQCIKEGTLDQKCSMQLVKNLLKKINAKLNGTNHKIAEDSHIAVKNVMFLDADVKHPSPDQKNIPSVVGVAASHGVNGTCYNMQYRLQQSTDEIIQDIDSIFSYHMQIYKNYQMKYPDHVIYYRHGVSDGQFKKVKDEELRNMRTVCERLNTPNTKITCIIAVKRHHTRFFPKDKTNNKFNNVDPGTVVDQRIVHPNEKQFFMVSHQSIQGIAKPTRYNVIEDEANMDIDNIQLLTHNLCHLFPSCNRAVSYPTPVYLAHLVALRGRVYLEGTQRFGNLQTEYNKRQIHKNIMELNSMYFV